MSQLHILIFSDDPEFAPTLIARWQTERAVPSFLECTTETWTSGHHGRYDMAIVGPLSHDNPLEVLNKIGYETRPVLYVAHRAAQAHAVRSAHPRVLVLNDYEGWVNAAVLLACEALRRVGAVNRARQAEQSIVAAERHAVLGRYMLDMRHSLNNALTSILGNSELLLLEPGSLSAEARDQISTIHSMSMRVHEIIQRFSSLESEMTFANKQSHSEMEVVAANGARGA
ncbi:MAG TPA: histidine kinase dimerization/phospho-acceptor domain-containing protein [Terriglobales bacterium]|nr:histidine kinase dimerization/phospho-acceptor domain-containing protein [Terriglobales bacterium]